MNDTKDALERARQDAQALHKKARLVTAIKHADILLNLESVIADARRLQSAVHGLTASQQADAKQHLRNAELALEEAVKDERTLKTASENDLKKLNAALRSRTAIALKSLSLALAAKRVLNKHRTPQHA